MPREVLSFEGLSNRLAESKTPKGKLFAMNNASCDQGILQIGERFIDVGSRPGANAADVVFGFGYGKFACNETQKLTVTGNPTGGAVVLRSPLQGATNSAAIPWNAYPTDAQTGIVPWTAFDDGELVFSGGPWPNEPLLVTYKGRYANAPESLLTLQTNSLSGGSTPTVVISELVAGGLSEVYLVVVQPLGTGTCTLYKVTSANQFATTTWTSIASGLSASDWFFLQFEDKVYGINGTDGIAYLQLGGAWSGTAGIAGVQNPVVAPIPTLDFTFAGNGAAGAFAWGSSSYTFGAVSNWGATPPVVTVGASGQVLFIKVKTAIANATTVQLGVTLAAPQDMSREDYFHVYLGTSIPVGDTVLVTQIDNTNTLFEEINGTPLTIDPTFIGNSIDLSNATNGNYQRSFHFGSAQRSQRSTIAKFLFTFTLLSARIDDVITLQLIPAHTWPNDQMATLDINAGPLMQADEYANSFFKISTGTESKLSPFGRSPKNPINGVIGNHVLVTVAGSSQLTTSDLIYIYRKNRFGIWSFLGSVANVTSGTTTFLDTNMIDELDAFPSFGEITLPGGFLPSSVGVFKGCMVLGADRKLWLSHVGQVLYFAPDPENLPAQSILDPTDSDNPRTVYMSVDRTEAVLSIVGQDSLYASGPDTAYSMTGGDTPDGLSVPRPLPGSRGCLSTRGGFQLSGGAVFPASSGLWYYAVSEGFTGVIQPGTIIEEDLAKDINGTRGNSSWEAFVSDGGANICGIVFQDETWIFNGLKYLKFTRNKLWESGTLSVAIKAVIGNPVNGLVALTTAGHLIKFAQVLTDAGATVNWTAATGLLDMPRAMMKNLEVQYTGTPSILLDSYDGFGGVQTQRFDTTDGRVNHWPTLPLVGYRHRFTFLGKGADTIQNLAVDFEDKASSGRGN